MAGVPFPLTTPRLVLRPFADADIDAAYLSWLADPEVTRFSNQRFRTHSESSARAYLDSFAGTPNHFVALTLRSTDRKIGTMTAYVSPQHRTADLGLLIGERSAWGQGYGLEAWTALMEALFAHLELRKITAGTLRPNTGMLKIMERSGMHEEAVRTRQELLAGKEEDVLYFARFATR
jgi:[ribosomal protein S5]-alanine N-acetyltransferase